MDVHYHLNGTNFVWNERNDEERDAIIGFDALGRFVVCGAYPN